MQGGTMTARPNFAEKLTLELNRTIKKPRNEWAAHFGIKATKFEGYLSGRWTPSLDTFAKLMKGVSAHRVASLIQLCE